MHLETKRGEEPPVLAALVALLKELLDRLLGVLALRDLLEGVVRHGVLEALELESVAGREEVVVVDHLDERLDLAAASNLLRAHRLRHLEWVALNTSGNHIREAVLLGSLVLLLDNNHLSHVSIAGLFHEDF